MMRTIPSLALSLSHPLSHALIQAAGGVHTQRKKRIKGYLRVTRAMGDLFLKHADFNGPPLPAFVRVKPPYFPPYIHCSPDVREYELSIDDRFLLLASDGLWEACTDEEVTAVLNSALLSQDQERYRLVRAHTQCGLESQFARFYSNVLRVSSHVAAHVEHHLLCYEKRPHRLTHAPSREYLLVPSVPRVCRCRRCFQT